MKLGFFNFFHFIEIQIIIHRKLFARFKLKLITCCAIPKLFSAQLCFCHSFFVAQFSSFQPFSLVYLGFLGRVELEGGGGVIKGLKVCKNEV